MIVRFIFIGIIFIAMLDAVAVAQEIYIGEPFGEALFDLSSSATMISHELSSGSPLERTDVFKFNDGRLVAVTSRAKKLGQPYSITELRETSSPTDKLSKALQSLRLVQLPKKHY
jgi:hypothetical protein